MRLVHLPLLLAAALVACDSGDADAGDGARTEDLPPEARTMRSQSGEATFDDAAAFLDLLPFEPLYPSQVPDEFELTSATIIPSPFFERDDDNSLNELWLEYRGDGGESDWVTVTQRMQRMDVSTDVPTRAVDLGASSSTSRAPRRSNCLRTPATSRSRSCPMNSPRTR